MPVSEADIALFNEQGYLTYSRVLTDDEIVALNDRIDDIACGARTHLPTRYIQQEAAFQDRDDHQTDPRDQLRSLSRLCYFDRLFEAVARKPAIVDVIEALAGPNIKLYCDQVFFKPPLHGSEPEWHQDSALWDQFAPQEAISCWIALDDATVDNGCLEVIPGSCRWGAMSDRHQDLFFDNLMVPNPVPIEIEAGSCLFHHGLTFHRTGANTTPNRRRAISLAYLRAETKYLGCQTEELRMMVECEKPPGEFRFMKIRGEEFPGCV